MTKSDVSRDPARSAKRHGDDDPAVAKRKIAKAGVKLAASLPSEKECSKLADQSLRAFITAVRYFATEAIRANRWTDAKLKSFASAMALADAMAEILLGGDVPPEKGATERREISCTENCRREKNSCMSECIDLGATEFPCWCCADCRLTNLACLADCIMSDQGPGGTGGPGNTIRPNPTA